MTQPSIAFYNRFFERWPEIGGAEEVGVRFLVGTEAARDADAVVFHLPTLPEDWEGLDKPRGQLWIAWSMESRTTCGILDCPEAAARFDLTMTHERGSDVWAPYFGPETLDGMLRPPRPKTATHPVVHLRSNPYDASGRTRYVFEMMRRVKVDSYGEVLRNRTEVIPPGWEARVELMGRYKLTLAFENSVSPDYVTEKFFDPLVAGSVPVYRGCAEVAELAPAADCYIDARDFSGPAELGAYLDSLDRDGPAYARLHAWRERGATPAFERFIERLREPLFTRLARAVRSRLVAPKAG